MNNARDMIRMRYGGKTRGRRAAAFAAPVVALALAAAFSPGPSAAQTLDPTLPRVSPSEQDFNAILRSQREQGQRSLDAQQFRFENNALRSRDLLERQMPEVPRPPCRPGEPGC